MQFVWSCSPCLFGMNLGKIELIRSEAVLLTCFNGGGGTTCRYCVRGGGDRGKTRFPTASQPTKQQRQRATPFLGW